MYTKHKTSTYSVGLFCEVVYLVAFWCHFWSFVALHGFLSSSAMLARDCGMGGTVCPSVTSWHTWRQMLYRIVQFSRPDSRVTNFFDRNFYTTDPRETRVARASNENWVTLNYCNSPSYPRVFFSMARCTQVNGNRPTYQRQKDCLRSVDFTDVHKFAGFVTFNRISWSRYSSTPNISKMVQDSAILTIADRQLTKSRIWSIEWCHF